MAMDIADAAQVCSEPSQTSAHSRRESTASRPMTMGASSAMSAAMPGMRYVSPQPTAPSLSVSLQYTKSWTGMGAMDTDRSGLHGEMDREHLDLLDGHRARPPGSAEVLRMTSTGQS